MKINLQKYNTVFFIFISIFLVFFSLYKSVYAPLTWDESETYLFFIKQNVLDIITYKNTDVANNHILNSLLIKFTVFLFGNNELAIRLPNILAFIIFLIFNFQLLNRYYKKFTIPFFILINANPYLLDFFSLARGYGLAMSFITAGIYYYSRYMESQNNKFYVLALLNIGLACIANFTSINVFIIIVLFHNIYLFLIQKKKISIKNIIDINKYSFYVIIPFTLILYLPVKKMFESHLIIVGGDNGFWSDTVMSLIQCFAYDKNYNNLISPFYQIIIIVFSVLFLLNLIFLIREKKQLNISQNIGLFLGFIIFFIFILTFLQNKLFNIPFLMSRFALFIYPVFILMSCFAFSNLYEKFSKRLLIIFLYTVVAIFAMHTSISLQSKLYYEWRYMTLANPDDLFERINKDRKSENDTVSLGSTWIYEPILNYYKEKLSQQHIKEISPYGISYMNNYMLVNKEDLDKLPENKFSILAEYPLTESYLVKYSGNDSNIRIIHIKASNGKYVYCDRVNDYVLKADRIYPDLLETYIMISNGDNNYFLYTYNFNIINTDMQNGINAKNGWKKERAQIVISKTDSTHYSIKTCNNKYWSYDENTKKITASGTRLDLTTGFEIIDKK